MVNIFKLFFLVMLFPFMVFGYLNQWFAEGFDYCDDADRGFFYSLVGFGFIHFVLLVDLTNVTVGMALSAFGGF